ncbi:carbohydrate ABC transporter permease [uncultured Subdoligranulum sp.]|uniref:carbohydrate ABC transporter permease n=1 Tax=uncultured Subdoligranulum sp. TaxID=512298 RepID=UPI00261D9EF1|nr:carbohydrate ABC transporter permease [uncultured Subdoligranulum sp.]
MKINKFAAALAYAVLIVISLVMIYPFLWMFFSSFKTNLEIVQDPLSLWPKEWVLTGYQNIATLAGNSIWHYIKNSLIISVGTTLVVVLSTALGGYALYRNRKLPFFGVIEKSFMVSLMYPAVLLLIPLYVIVVNFHLYGSGNYLGIILASSTGAWGAALPFFLFKQFFDSMPYELLEAATIDGASEIRLFTRITMPVMYPVFTTATLISFLTSWGLWLPVLMLSQDMSTYNLAAMLVNLNSDLGVDLSQTAALSTVISLPVVVVFLLTQRKVMEGIAAGSVKG